MAKIVLGLDLGITSIGWALVKIDDDRKENNVIIDSGIRIFQIAENPKDGKSLALPRRNARGARRTTKRRAQKISAVKRLLLNEKLITQEELDHLFLGNKGQIDVWTLRKEALDRLLDSRELSRIMVHIAKHRGYFSNRKSAEATDSEGKAVLSGIDKNKSVLKRGIYRTIGEYMATKTRKRNSRANYENSIARSMLADEIRIIFERQRSFGNTFAHDELLEQYTLIAFSQRPMKSVEDMVAMCSFEPDEKRAPKAAHTFEKFRALQKLKNIRLLTQNGEVALTQDQIHRAIEEAKEAKTFTYKTLKSKLGLPNETLFKGLNYFDVKTGEKLKKDPEKRKLLDFTAYQKIRDVVSNANNEYWEKISADDTFLDSIAEILSVEKDDEVSLKRLCALIDDLAVCQTLLKISFSGFAHISTKALKNIVPFLEEGMDYDKACEAASYDFKALFKGEKSLLLPPLSDAESREMTNPVVKRAIVQMRLVYNAVARKYGAIDAVHIELTRDIKKSHQDRNEISKLQGEFQERKEEARKLAVEILGKDPNAKELLKFRLWQEQNQFCIYSGKRIEAIELMDPFATEVDHILPYSRSLDDAMNNKVLCLTRENQYKGNRTPFEYFGADSSSDVWHEFSMRVEGMKNLKDVKKTRLLKMNFDASSEKSFKERNKNDTSYIAKFVKNYIEAHITFKPSKQKQNVFTMNGMLTSQLRFKWGVGDKNRQTHLHHAEDAIILAFATQRHVQKLSKVSARREGFIYTTKEEKDRRLKFEPPMENFHEKVRASVENIFVSFMPRRKVTGAAHKETIYSKKVKSKGVFEVNGGVAEYGEIKRVDVFVKDNQYHFVFLYVHDFIADELSNKTIKGDQLDESFHFKFSIFKNDLINVQLSDRELFGYFINAESDGRFNILPNREVQIDRSKHRVSVGPRSLKKMQKYQVDVLGNYVEVKEEKRIGTKKQLAITKKLKSYK